MRRILGCNLPAALQAQAKARFVHRSTGDHQQGAALDYPLQFASDAEWLANTLFWITAAGLLSRRARFCESTPTWPNNPELRKAKGVPALGGVNREGLTYAEWRAAADCRFDTDSCRKAWLNGEDPTEYAAEL